MVNGTKTFVNCIENFIKGEHCGEGIVDWQGCNVMTLKVALCTSHVAQSKGLI